MLETAPAYMRYIYLKKAQICNSSSQLHLWCDLVSRFFLTNTSTKLRYAFRYVKQYLYFYHLYIVILVSPETVAWGQVPRYDLYPDIEAVKKPAKTADLRLE